jgi:hypothetical protein
MRPIPHAAGLYLAVLQLVVTLGATVYAIYLPRLAASVGISRDAALLILMLDQAIFAITDFAMGAAADKVSRRPGGIGRWVAAITLLGGAAFVGLPFVAGSGAGAVPFLAINVVWAVTSSALRAPPLMLLGKYAARPAVPYLASLAMLGVGIASALSPYLTIALREQDPRLPFVIAGVALVLTSLALAPVERMLARQAPATPQPPASIDRELPAPRLVFALATVTLALGFQMHFFLNSGPAFKYFVDDITDLLPVFWIGFSIGMFPASLLTRLWGGLPVMGVAGSIGAIAIVLMAASDALGATVVAQLVVGAAWGAMLISAFTAAAALGAPGAEGRITGLLFSALALATLVRMVAIASGALADPAWTPLLHWGPALCWAITGAVLVALSAAPLQRTLQATD